MQENQKSKKTKHKPNTPWQDKTHTGVYSDDHKPNLNFNTFIRNNGNFVPLSQPLVEFMGLANAVFLTAIMKHYNYLRDHKHKEVKNGVLFYSASYFQKTWGLSPYQQNRAIRELKKCCLLKEVGKTFRNQKVLQINILAACCLLQLAYDIQSEVNLSSFFKKILSNIEFRRMIREKLKGMDTPTVGSEIPQDGKFSYKIFKNTILDKLKIYS